MTPQVSIVIPNYRHPEVINVCLRSLEETEGDYEVIVVDNDSDHGTVDALKAHRDAGRIDQLILNRENLLYSGGCNTGVAAARSDEFVLCLNSDVAFLRPDWLTKLVAWADGTIEYRPSIWGFNPTVPDPGPRDIVSAGFSWDPAVLPSRVRPEGFCLLVRREWWRDFSMDLPWHGGMEKSIAESIRAGAKCGVLSQYPPFFVHREGASGKPTVKNLAEPDIAGWFAGLRVETLDFTFGEDEHSSYLDWS